MLSSKPSNAPGPVKTAYAYDLEAGAHGISSPGRAIKRAFGRRVKLVLGLILVSGLFLLWNDWGGGGPGGRPPSQPGWEDGETDQWGEHGRHHPHSDDDEWRWRVGPPFEGDHPPPPPPAGDEPEDWEDELDTTKIPLPAALLRAADEYIAPMHPDVSLLPSPSELFPDVSIPSFFTPPRATEFPESRLREIISEPTEDQPSSATQANLEALPDESFAKTWQAPEMWDQPRGDVRRVQWEGFAGGRDQWESEEEMQVRIERREAVRRGFAWAWQGYKEYAWGHDEVKPVSLEPSDPFNGWGASIIDTLDTLLIMGLSDEYNICRPHVNQLNLHWISGRDWFQGYTSEPEADPNDDEQVTFWSLPRDKGTGLAVFETGIRYLGGLLGAYDLSGDALLLERAVELGDVLAKAFRTKSGLPAGRIDPGSDADFFNLGQVSLAEVGSMSLELIRLSQATGDRRWFDLAQRATDYLDERIVPRAVHTPLIPMWFMPDISQSNPISGGLTFGGLADSYYEYLVKAYKLLGASEGAQQYRKLYEGSIDRARELLYTPITVVPGRDLLAIGKLEGNRLIPEIEHLTCFAGAMLGLGAKLLDRANDMVDALKFTGSCYWLSAATPTGIQPEVVEFYEQGLEEYINVSQEGKILPSGSVGDKRGMHRDFQGILRWNKGGGVVPPRDDQDEASIKVDYTERLKGSPPGARKVVGRGINRPETIESIFYMYRLTGDRKWQEKGWKMFVSWVSAAKVDGGFSSIHDVTSERTRFSDNMESFMFAETLKYHYLLQSEPDVLSLDDYVLNTEAHPFLTSSSITPGSQRLWHQESNDQDLGVRGQGTNAQKWMRLHVLESAKNAMQSSRNGQAKNRGGGGGGGRGMGGGGGRPGIPQIPPEFHRGPVPAAVRD
ncbi:glycosyl hydrolase family 47-domain-containing protein [Naematelia encephala]|uniref:alpha-1,2-Mannosidase n=1 Tax=Naematelia encephala TaxID=71784 RepID=A0A1Y2B5D3_9TREE|nr:glycosyl hydrolase family 47-domain-containing protein [Naematelia encephala]